MIEDNADLRHGLRTLLEIAGHQVVDAEDAESGLAALETFEPDAMLVDLGLPGRDGFPAARAPHARAHRPYLVALTYDQAADRRRTQETGFDAHLVKPVDLENLEAVLARAPAPHLR